MGRSVQFIRPRSKTWRRVRLWYAARSGRAANRFLDDLDCIVEQIVEAPNRYAGFEPNLRRAVFRRFPFYVVFSTDEGSVTVIAVAHAKRRPRLCLDRV